MALWIFSHVGDNQTLKGYTNILHKWVVNKPCHRCTRRVQCIFRAVHNPLGLSMLDRILHKSVVDCFLSQNESQTSVPLKLKMATSK